MDKTKTAVITVAAVIAFVGIKVALYKWDEKENTKPQKQESSISESKSDYEIHVDDKWIVKSGDKYTLVISYVYTNNSGKPQNFVWACQDKAFLDGIECSLSYEDYPSASCFHTYANRSDDILSGKTVWVNVGYEMPKFDPEKEQEILIRITKPLDTSAVMSETTFKSSEISVRGDK